MAVVIIRFFSFPEDFIASLLVLIIDVFLLHRQAVGTSSSRLLDSSLGGLDLISTLLPSLTVLKFALVIVDLLP